MSSWWQGTEAIRTQLTSGVESIKKATQDIANELAEVDNIQDDDDQELHYDTNDQTLRFQQMYRELQTAYNEQEKELNELRSVNEINQTSVNKATDQLFHSQQTNIKLKQQLQDTMDQLSTQQNEINESTRVQSLEEQLSQSKDEYHEFKKKTKAKWDEVKVKFQTQRQNFKDLEKENKDLKEKLEHTEGDTLMDKLRKELDETKQKKLNDDKIYNKEINALKEESKHRLNDITKQFEAIQHKLEENKAKCIGFEEQMENDKQSMIFLSKQHKQYKVLVEEQEIEIKGLKNEIERNKHNALQQLSIDDRTRNIIQDLNDKNNELKGTISILQRRISCITSSFEGFRRQVSLHLRCNIRPSVALIEKEYAELKNKYRKVNKSTEVYALEIADLKQKYETNGSSWNELQSEYESFRSESADVENENTRLKQSNHTLQEEISNLENQMKHSMDQYKQMLQAKEDEWVHLRQDLSTIIYGAEEGQQQHDTMTIKELLLSLTQVQREKNENEENIQIIMKECGISSRVLAIKLLNDNGDVSSAIFKYNETSNESMNELKINKDKMNEYESIINQLKASNTNISLELNVGSEKYSKLESEWIVLCNKFDEITNRKNELEEECDALHEEIEYHQSALEETRMATQELIDQETAQTDKLMKELADLGDENKVLLAQKKDLTSSLHSKLVNTNTEELNEEIELLNDENDRLKLNINSLKEMNKKKMNSKDEDIIELNTIINELKLENEELKALETDYIDLTAKYNCQNKAFLIKKTAFNNLQIAFDALQMELNKLCEIKKNKTDSCSNKKENTQHLQIRLNEMVTKYESVTKQFQDIRTSFAQSQKYQIRLEHETATLRSTISKTAIKLKNLSSENDSVDRRIIIKLLITFFDRWYNGGNTKEVITLISKILKFNEFECKKCRITTTTNNNNNNQGLWGYATSWMTPSYNNDDNHTEPSPSPSKDLGSLWVEFLLNELGDNDDDIDGNNNNINGDDDDECKDNDKDIDDDTTQTKTYINEETIS